MRQKLQFICQLVIMFCGQVSFVLLIYRVRVLQIGLKLLVQNSKDVPLLDVMVKTKCAVFRLHITLLTIPNRAF